MRILLKSSRGFEPLKGGVPTDKKKKKKQNYSNDKDKRDERDERDNRYQVEE